jgi:hypothetical protein
MRDASPAIAVFAILATASDVLHLGAMLAWALGLPLLFWRRRPRLSAAYGWFALAFVLVSQASHVALGECFLTTLSRSLWEAAGDPTVGSFTARLVNKVAGFSPSDREVVILWEIAILATAAAVLLSLHRRLRPDRPA